MTIHQGDALDANRASIEQAGELLKVQLRKALSGPRYYGCCVVEVTIQDSQIINVKTTNEESFKIKPRPLKAVA